jgi:hypothetical protein
MRSPVLIAVLVLAVPGPAAGAHEWYRGLQSPSGIPCCDERDCRSVAYRLNSLTGQEEILANGIWWPVEHDKVLPMSAPDGGAHACWGNLRGKPFFRCIIIPGQASLGPKPPAPAPPPQDTAAGVSPATGLRPRPST